jgi:transcriptional regulator with XRE-family HTH domain
MMVTLAFTAPKPAPMAAEKSDFASRVLAARKALGLSQQALSDQSGIPISTLKNYELGHSSPSAENLQKMHAAGINPMWVLLGHQPILNRDLKVASARSTAAKAVPEKPSAKAKVKATVKAQGGVPTLPGNPRA